MKRAIIIVLDSVGIGELPDAADFGDVGSNTLVNIKKVRPQTSLPNLCALGLGDIQGKDISLLGEVAAPKGCYGKMAERSIGKDTTTGHWEMAGIITAKPFPTFTETGFPKEVMDAFEAAIGTKTLGNYAESGTVIIQDLGVEHMKTGYPIVYTSADSVLQICGNEETFGLDELYRCCEIAREITMKEEWRVGRVIARPYVGKKKGEFVRTSNRHDYALKPTGTTALDVLKDNGYDVISVGKIRDIFDGQGITEAFRSKSSVHGMEQTIEICKDKDFKGLCFVNLVDFDALWGHRRNPVGYGEELERFDAKLGELLENLREDDLLMITADHGNDPTYTGTDHTREKVPFIAYSPSMKEKGMFEEQKTFGVIGATVLDNFGLKKTENMIGESILKELE